MTDAPAPRAGSAARLWAAAAATMTLMAACSAHSADAAEVPSRPPDVLGTVAGEPGAAYLVDTSPITDFGPDYFEGMSIATEPARGETVAVGSDDRALPSPGLEAGDVVEVWIGDVCAESSPVQCDVVAIRVTAQAG